MPATGLQDVKQKIGVDYDDGYQKIANDARELAVANTDAMRTVGDLNRGIREQLQLARDAERSFSLVTDEIRDQARAANELMDKYANMGDAARKVTAEQDKIAQGMLEITKGTDGVVRSGSDFISVTDAMVSKMGLAGKAASDHAIAMKALETETKKMIETTDVMVTSTGSSLDSHLSKITAVSRAIESVHAAAAAARRADDGGGGLGAALGSAIGGGGGSGMAAVFAALGAAPGGGGGRGGGGGAPSFVPWAGGGAAAVRFWGMMAAETAATVVPALAAAGTAALVGVQSVEAMIPRYKAIFSTSEALGSAFNMTTGKFLGGGTALQQAQDRFQGGGYVLAGNLLSIIQGGGGQGFIDMGGQTLGMLARGTSQMAVNFSQGGMGKRLSDMLGGGPEYLRQFGDIGANLGNTLLNVAPNLPGVGQDMLATLSGGTGLLAMLSRDVPGPLIGALLSYEAASRWGPALAGGQGLIGRMLGLRGVGGIGGLIGKAGGFLAERAPLGSALEGLGFGMSGFGGGLAALGGPELGAAGLMAYGLGKLVTYKSPAQQQVAAMQAGIDQAGFSEAWKPLAQAVTKAVGLAAQPALYAGVGTPVVDGRHLPGGRVAAGIQAAAARSPQGVMAAAALDFANQTGELANAAPELKSALFKAGLKSISLADAFQIGQNALLDMSHAFGKDGKLTAAAQQMVTAYARVIAPMTQSSGAFGAAVGAQTIMSQGAMQNLAKVNSAMDAYQQIIAGGPTGASALAAGAGAAPAHAIAAALTGFTSPANAAAWQAFASTSPSKPGFITQMQQFGDQMRTYLTLGTADLGQTKGFSAFELQRILPQARQSSAALAMLMQQGAAAGVTGYYDTSKSQAQNYKDVAAALHSAAFSSSQFNKNMNAVTIATANIPAVAKTFADMAGTTAQADRLAHASKDIKAIREAAVGGGGPFGGGTFGVDPKINMAAVKDLVSQLRAAGVQGGAAMKASLDAILSRAGIGKALRVKIEAQVTGLGPAEKLKALIASIHGKNVTVNASANAAAVDALKNAIAGVHGKSVTITVTTINRMITQAVGAGIIHTAGGVLGATMVGGPAGMRLTGHASGGLIPGSGSGDTYPAMLTPGEAVVPKNLVPLIAPFLAAHKVPGFGGVPGTSGAHFALGGMVPVNNIFPRIPDPIREVISGHLGKAFVFKLMDEITKALNAASARHIATALMHKIAQELQYAKSVSASMKSGLNIGGMNVDPASGAGSVADQMQSYLTSMKAFSKDISALSHGHLNKDILKQIIAAGPVQGDALAQSILNPGGTSVKSGIGQVNQLFAQIGKMSNIIGAQAGAAVFGGTLAPNLKSGTFVNNNVSISISGQGGNSLGGLTDKQINQLVAMIQKKLLQQAQRNRGTGIKLKSRNA